MCLIARADSVARSERDGVARSGASRTRCGLVPARWRNGPTATARGWRVLSCGEVGSAEAFREEHPIGVDRNDRQSRHPPVDLCVDLRWSGGPSDAGVRSWFSLRAMQPQRRW